MDEKIMLREVISCYQDKISAHGSAPEGVYWNSSEAQEIRFAQLVKVCSPDEPFSIIDYGCGYGALLDYMHKAGYRFTYTGYDMLAEMIAHARQTHDNEPACSFTTAAESLRTADYVVESGIFNLKMDVEQDIWTDHVLKTLARIDCLSNKGFSFNMLTKYSDPERMRSDLYYADPCFFFDYCKRHFSRNVALLHDYDIYDFTITVRKQNQSCG